MTNVWKPYSKNMRAVTVRKVQTLTPAQIEALAKEVHSLPRSAKVSTIQTWSESGGTHLYVKINEPGERHYDELHVAANGTVFSLGAQ